jgi:hypothetical protein
MFVLSELFICPPSPAEGLPQPAVISFANSRGAAE